MQHPGYKCLFDADKVQFSVPVRERLLPEKQSPNCARPEKVLVALAVHISLSLALVTSPVLCAYTAPKQMRGSQS